MSHYASLIVLHWILTRYHLLTLPKHLARPDLQSLICHANPNLCFLLHIMGSFQQLIFVRLVPSFSWTRSRILDRLGLCLSLHGVETANYFFLIGLSLETTIMLYFWLMATIVSVCHHFSQRSHWWYLLSPLVSNEGCRAIKRANEMSFPVIRILPIDSETYLFTFKSSDFTYTMVVLAPHFQGLTHTNIDFSVQLKVLACRNSHHRTKGTESIIMGLESTEIIRRD